MKRINFFAIILVLLFLLPIGLMATETIIDSTQATGDIATVDWGQLFTWNNLYKLLAFLFGSGFLIISAKYVALSDLILTFIKYKSEDSDGGTKLTQKELSDLFNKFLKTVKGLLAGRAARVFGFLGKIVKLLKK